MSFKNDGLRTAEYVYDFDVDGGAQGKIVLSDKANKAPIPVGAIVKDVHMKVVTAFTSGGSATLDIGNDDDEDGYLGQIAVAALTDNALFNAAGQDSALLWDGTNDHMIPLNVLDAADGEVSVTIGTADMTAGKAIILVDYYMPSED